MTSKDNKKTIDRPISHSGMEGHKIEKRFLVARCGIKMHIEKSRHQAREVQKREKNSYTENAKGGRQSWKVYSPILESRNQGDVQGGMDHSRLKKG